MTKFENLDQLRGACPPDTNLVGPYSLDGLQLLVNGRVEAACLRSDGTHHGPSITWYETGSKAMAGDYHQGLKGGEWFFWHDNGQISGRGRFCNGKPNGGWVTWHDNGQKESEGNYLEGLHHGHFTYWDRSGHIIKVLHYEQGNLLNTIPYRNGKPVN